jgi:hypothetical protein
MHIDAFKTLAINWLPAIDALKVARTKNHQVIPVLTNIIPSILTRINNLAP